MVSKGKGKERKVTPFAVESEGENLPSVILGCAYGWGDMNKHSERGKS